MKKRVGVCENASINGRGISVSPQCWNNQATLKTTVEYHELESDTSNLCSECSAALKKDAKKHGYKVYSVKLERG